MSEPTPYIVTLKQPVELTAVDLEKVEVIADRNGVPRSLARKIAVDIAAEAGGVHRAALGDGPMRIAVHSALRRCGCSFAAARARAGDVAAEGESRVDGPDGAVVEVAPLAPDVFRFRCLMLGLVADGLGELVEAYNAHARTREEGS